MKRLRMLLAGRKLRRFAVRRYRVAWSPRDIMKILRVLIVPQIVHLGEKAKRSPCNGLFVGSN